MSTTVTTREVELGLPAASVHVYVTVYGPRALTSTSWPPTTAGPSGSTSSTHVAPGSTYSVVASWFLSSGTPIRSGASLSGTMLTVCILDVVNPASSVHVYVTV